MSKSFKSAANKMNSSSRQKPPAIAPVNDEMWSIGTPQQGQTGPLSISQIRALNLQRKSMSNTMEEGMPQSEKDYWMNRGKDIMSNKISTAEKGIKTIKDSGSGELEMLKNSYVFLGMDLGMPSNDQTINSMKSGRTNDIMKSVKKAGGSDADAKEFVERLYIFNQNRDNNRLKPSDKQRKFFEMTRDNAKSSFLKEFASKMKSTNTTGLDIGMPADTELQILQVFEGKEHDIPPQIVNEAKNFYKTKDNYLNWMRSISPLNEQQKIQAGFNTTPMNTIQNSVQSAQQNPAMQNQSKGVTISDVETNPLLMRAASVLSNTMIKKPEPQANVPTYNFK